MAQSFKCGDVVQLLSGGPAMTVAEVFQNGVVSTQWFVKGKLQEGDFLPGNLKVGSPDDGEGGE